MKGRRWIWITGNHDPKPPAWIGGEVHDDLHIQNLKFCHQPGNDHPSGEVIGHFHPSAKIRQRGKSVRRRCFAEDGSRMILPAFGAFTGGLNVLDPAFDGILNRQSLTAWMIGSDTVYRIDGKRLVG